MCIRDRRDRFEKKGDIINNQLAFVGNSVTMKSYNCLLYTSRCV